MSDAHSTSKRSIWIALSILSIVTVSEIALALAWPDAWSPLLLNLIFILMTITKAFYIVAEFMHLKYEVKNLIISILVPMTLFIWFIIAFLSDGNSWMHYRAF